MDTGNFLQIVITLVAILGAGAVALVCDMLKTNNERLREANLELRVRREEEQRRTELAVDQLKRMSAAAGERLLTAAAPGQPSGASMPRAVEAGGLSIGTGVAMERLASALASPVTGDAAAFPAHGERGSTIAEARQLAREFLKSKAPGDRQAGAPDIASAAAEPAAAAGPPQRPPRKNWDQLLKGGARRATIDVTPVPTAVRPKGELIPFESLHGHQGAHSQPETQTVRLPSGFHGMAELSKLLDMRKPLTGLVISVALNGSASSETGDSGIPAGTLRGAASEFVRSVLEPGEFACQSAIDQFLIVSGCNAETAQRRLTDLTDKLWSFQLRTDLADSMVLSWGSYEASGEAVADAVTCAMQRMEENRRSRTVAAASSDRQRRVV